MKNYFKTVRARVIAVVLVAALAGTVVGALTQRKSSPVTDIANVIYAPLQSLAAVIAEKSDSFFGSFRSASVYREEVSALQDQVAGLQDQLADYEKTKQKLSSYEALLGVRDAHPDYTYLPASVVSRNNTQSARTFTADKGAADGVSVNDPVVFGNSVVGLVIRVNTATCVVRTILDPSLNISAYDTRSRENGYTNTTARLSADGLVRFSGLTRETAVTVGSMISTSGLGGIFPRDLKIGTVSELLDEATDISVYAVLQPAVATDALSDVFIITSFAGQAEEAVS